MELGNNVQGAGDVLTLLRTITGRRREACGVWASRVRVLATRISSANFTPELRPPLAIASPRCHHCAHDVRSRPEERSGTGCQARLAVDVGSEMQSACLRFSSHDTIFREAFTTPRTSLLHQRRVLIHCPVLLSRAGYATRTAQASPNFSMNMDLL
jgi:hypothetical protein